MSNAGQSLRGGSWVHGAAGVGAVLFLALFPIACMTPDKAVRQTNETGNRLATEYWQRQTGSTNALSLSRPADALTLRVALLAVVRGDQGVVFPTLPASRPFSVSNGVLTLTLKESLCVAARNDRPYQKLKETIFSSALSLDYQQYQFETSFSGILLALLEGDPDAYAATGKGTAGLSRKFESGAELTGQLALDVVNLLRDDWRSMGLTGDLTMTVPLMRGSGREIVREPLTQAERDLVYAIHTFEAYRQGYAVSVATAYFDAMEYVQRLRNALDNEHNLSENCRRAEMMFEAGRMQRIQVDQARSDLLDANETVIATRKSYEAKLDAFKVKIGLPPEAKIAQDPEELGRLERRMERLARVTRTAVDAFPDEGEACRIALAKRHDLIVTRGDVEDAERAVKIAADALRADVALTGRVDLDRSRATGEHKFSGDEGWSAQVRTDLPWERRKERNAFRKQQIALEQAKRALETLEDTVKQSVRTGMRNLIAARASYENQVESVRVAHIRVESNVLFLQSGRSSMRDVLEAQKALLLARNALCAALIDWRLTDLELRRDMGVLEIDAAGMWRGEDDGADHG